MTSPPTGNGPISWQSTRQVADRLRGVLETHNSKQAEPRWPWTGTTAINVDRDLSQEDQPDDEFAYWSN